MALQTTGTRIFKDGIDFFHANMRGILMAVAVPGLISLALALMITNTQTQTLMEQLRNGVAENKLNPLSLKFGLLVFAEVLIGLWFSVRAYRYRLAGEFPVEGSELSAILWMAGYMLLLAVIMVVAIVTIVLTALLIIGLIALALGISPQTGPADPRAAMLTVVMVLAIIPAYLYAIYAVFRFALAFPGIAIGRREHIFRTMWPMARGVALPILAWFFLMGIGMLLLYGVVLFATVGFETIIPTPAAHEKMLQDPGGFIRAQVIFALIIAVPNFVFRALGATVFAEAYAQLNRGRSSAASQPPLVEPQTGGWQ
jgi:hypothetical protein